MGPFAHFLLFRGTISSQRAPRMPANDSLIGQLRAAAARVASSYGLEIFELQFRRESIGWVLRVILDRVPAGPGPEIAAAPESTVTIEDCQRALP